MVVINFSVFDPYEVRLKSDARNTMAGAAVAFKDNAVKVISGACRARRLRKLALSEIHRDSA